MPMEYFEQRERALLGDRFDVLYAAPQETAERGVTVSALRSSPEQFAAKADFPLEASPFCKAAFVVHQPDFKPGRHPYYHAGVFYSQEPSASSAAPLLGVRPGMRVLDMCAAPGGKSSQLAAALQGHGVLVSNEYVAARADILKSNLERMGVSNAVVLNESPARIADALPEFFDRVLVDAPCSGEGMFRKNEEAVEQWSLENVKLCAGRQEEILECAYTMLMGGGILVYSTCTFAPEEDEEMIAHFLAKHPDMKLLPIPLAGGMEPGLVRQEALMKLLQNQGQSKRETTYDMEERFRKELQKTVRLWPHKVNGEGHFAALLQKEGTACLEVNGREMNRDLISNMGEAPCVMRSASHSSSRDCDRKKMKKGSTFQKGKDKKSQSVSNQMTEAIAAFEQFEAQTLKSSWREGKESATYLTFGDQLYLVPEGTPDLHGLKVLRPGLHLGTFKKNRFEPSHALALSLKSKDVKDTIDLSVEDAIKYIEGYTFPAEDRKGWCLVTVEGYSLGFGKAAGGSLKNHYPKGLRKSC